MFRAGAEDEVKLDSGYRLREDAHWLEYVRQELSRPGSRIFVADAPGGNALAGFVHVRKHSAARPNLRRRLLARRRPLDESDMVVRTGPWGSVEHLYVVEGSRRAGIGTALVTRAAAWLAESGVMDVETRVHGQNEASLALFGSLGFAEVRRLLRKGM